MLRTSSNAEAPMQAAKWLTLPVLMDYSELLSLFSYIKPFFIYPAGQIVSKEKETISQEEFLDIYKYYIDHLKIGKIPEESVYRTYFSGIFTRTFEALYAVEVPHNRHLIKISRPVVQLQPHRMTYSSLDNKFRSNVHGPETINWGILFSYPQLYLDPDTKQPHKIIKSDIFPNTELFHLLRKWMRDNTLPTPFEVNEHIHHIPMRIGKKCFEWINQHPQLLQKKIKVITLNEPLS